MVSEKVPEKKPLTSNKPLATQKRLSKYNIEENLKEKEVVQEEKEEVLDDNLPKQHFTNEDVLREWETFLTEIEQKDKLIHFAINGFKVSKKGDDIQINYPSVSSKVEFEKVSREFLSRLKQNLNNHYISIDYQINVKEMKKEVVTKRKIFEQFCDKNPLLNDLNQIFQFDLN
ncbi:MAG: hypothetical protein CSA38_04820 [Flavobacteriales bacterium]|nr:MAG: hypothetical protein CSA38_04820 [Flavobacteriales bacterium]